MPLGRERRQQRQASKLGRPRTPSVDAFGTLRFPGEGEARGRLIEYDVHKYAFFTEGNVTDPVTFAVDDASIKGRIFTATLQNSGSEIKFQKAGCGCETPYSLRGGRNKLIREAGLEVPAEPAPDTLMQQILDGEVPGV